MKRKQTANSGIRLFRVTLLIIISILLLDILRRNVFDSSDGKITVLGKFKNSPNIQNVNTEIVNNPEATDSSMLSDAYSGFCPVIIKASEYLGKGSLAVINSQYGSQDFYLGLSDLASDVNYSEYYSVYNYQTYISEEVVPNLNQMMSDYNSATEKSNMIVYNTTNYLDESSLYTEYYPEAPAGYSLDLAVLSSSGDVIEYDGLDTESWIISNCHNYGFVVRYPEDKAVQTGYEYAPYHLRYVGLPHAMIMNEKNMCLEEYTQFLKTYTFDNPFVYNLNGTEYNIYYSPLVSAETSVQVPVSGYYDISGNNYDGYIISYSK